MNCAKNECNTFIIAPKRHQQPSSGANRPSDITVTVNLNAEFNLKAVNSIIECISRDLVPEYSQGLESSAVYTAPPIFVESLHGHSNSSLPWLLLQMPAEEIIPTFLTSNICIGLCPPETLTLTGVRSYKMFEVLLIRRVNKSMFLRGILNFHLLRDAVPYRLAREIPPKEGVMYPLQCKV